jgi:hypothetical protein
MNELLSLPDVKKNVEKMTDLELDFFKRMLVSQGIYQRYCAERKHGR